MLRGLLASLIFTLGVSAQQTYTIRINPDGSFTPRTLSIKSGDTVRWENLSRGDSVIPVNSAAYPGMCSARAAYDATDPNNVTGPLPQAASGVFVMGIHGLGYSEVASTATCPGNLDPVLSAGGKKLCVGAAYQATMDATWKSPNNSGVFIRLLWKDVNPSEGTYDFTVLRREMENAVANGKLFSLSIKAGANGTPDWIFSTNANGTLRANNGGGVPRLRLEDNDDGADATTCGNRMDLGNPTNARYQQLYFNMMIAVANFIKTRADWYRSLAYIKTSGANLVSEENRLPKNCRAGCICNPKVFADDGYRPSKLKAYYDALTDLLRDNFPGKTISYALIQDGFPLVNETGGWETTAGTSSNAQALPGAFEQMQTNLDSGQTRLGLRFAVSHNGVQPKPAARCNFDGQHPKPVTTLAGYWDVGSGCPNRWAVREGAEGQITGYQTTNFANGVNSPAAFDSAFQNQYDNTDGIYMELYEEMFWLISNTSNGLLPSGRTLGQWADLMHTRRVDPIFRNFTQAGVPYPTTWSKTFSNTSVSGGPQTLTYVHGAKCGAGNLEYGQITIAAAPPAVRAAVSASGFGGASSAAPGTWIEIYGTGLAATVREWTGADFTGANAPAALDGVSVRVGGQAAFISYVNPAQVNAQLASSTPVGAQPLIVTTPAGAGAPYTINVSATQPGLSAPAVFNLNGRQYVTAQFADGAFALPPNAIPGVATRRAKPGDVLTLYGIGFGAVTPSVQAGQITGVSNALAVQAQFTIGGVRATTTYSGLAPGAVGLYQFNVVVPQVAANDLTPVSFTLGGVAGTQSLVIATQN